MDLREVDCGAENWIDLVRDRERRAYVKSGNEPSGSLKVN